jgi:hypothetical protein
MKFLQMQNYMRTKPHSGLLREDSLFQIRTSEAYLRLCRQVTVNQFRIWESKLLPTQIGVQNFSKIK